MTEPKTELLNDHVEIERLLTLFARAVDSNDGSEELQCLWARVERMIVDHLDTEEREFFGLVAREHRREVEALRADHQHVRDAVAAIAVQLELHTVRKPQVDELILFLRKHAERENETLYRWLSERPDGFMAAIVRRMLTRRAHGNHQYAD